jgi:hypothetical protein
MPHALARETFVPDHTAFGLMRPQRHGLDVLTVAVRAAHGRAVRFHQAEALSKIYAT